MKRNPLLHVGLILAAAFLTACSSVRLSEAPVEDRTGVPPLSSALAGTGGAGAAGSGSNSAAAGGVGGASGGSSSAGVVSPVAVRPVVPVEVAPRSGSTPMPGGVAGSAGAAGSQGNATGNAAGVAGALAAVPSNLARVIYFEFDSFEINAEGVAVLDGHARFLSANKSRSVDVEGHTDERGGREYNLALGQKRAEAVRRRLTLLGVAEGQIQAVSLGEEKPAMAGSDETAYAKNRRAEIRYR